MEIYYLLIISKNPSLEKDIQAALGELIGNNSSSLSFQILSTRNETQAIDHPQRNLVSAVLVDLDSLKSSCETIFEMLSQGYPGKPLLCISDQTQLKTESSLQPEFPVYILSRSDITCQLLAPFLINTISQASLIEQLRVVQDDLNQRLSELQSIRRASLHLTLNLSLDSVLDAILESALELVQAEDTHIFLYEQGLLHFGAALFDGAQQQKPYMDPRPEGITYQVAKSGSKYVVNDVMNDPLFTDRPWQGSIISLPLKIGEDVLGVMNAALKIPHQFTDNEIRALEMLGDQAAIAIYNAKLYQQAQLEIQERIRAEESIKHLANHDALTGLPNRRLFNERILLEISHARRDQQKLAVLLFDLDQLKRVNDSFGHDVGDLLLQAVGQRLIGLLRKSDTVSRMGGDEFLVILPGLENPEAVVITAERILSALSTPFQLEGNHIQITTSIGISIFPDDGEEVSNLVKKADSAMYHAKQKGGNTFHLYHP